MPPPVAFELLHTLKELQAHHGLRTDDYARYHAHCTTRLRTLRKQLKLASDYKKAVAKAKRGEAIAYAAPKPVTAANATTDSHVLLVALQVERALAESQEAAVAAAGGGAASHHGNDNKKGFGTVRHTRDGGRKRLNKAARLAEELKVVVDAAGDERLKLQAEAYVCDVRGRCELAHGRFDEAIAKFASARTALLALRTSSTQAQWDVLGACIVEVDDRIGVAYEGSGRGAHQYRPAPVDPSVVGGASAAGSGEDVAKYAHIQWLGRKVDVVCLPVKAVLRDLDKHQPDQAFHAILAALADVEKEHGGPAAAWITFQLQSTFNRAIDACDRSVAAVNEGLDAVRHDLKASASIAGVKGAGSGGSSASASSDRAKSLRMLQLCLTYHQHRLTVLRTVLVTEQFRARYSLTLALLDQQHQQQLVVGNASGTTATCGGGGGAKQSMRLVGMPTVAEAIPAELLASLGLATSSAALQRTMSSTMSGTRRQGRKALSFGQQHIAAPHEIERLCETTIREAGEALMLPGVEDNETLSAPLVALRDEATAVRDLYAAEGWLVVIRHLNSQSSKQPSPVGATDMPTAVRAASAFVSRCLQTIEQSAMALPKKADLTERAKVVQASVAAEEEALKLVAAPAVEPSPSTRAYSPATAPMLRSLLLAPKKKESVPKSAVDSATKKGATSSAIASAPGKGKQQHQQPAKNEPVAPPQPQAAPATRQTFVADAAPGVFEPCTGLVQFPPSFRSMPAKPTFVDVAATYLDYPMPDGEVKPLPVQQTPQQQGEAAAAEEPKKKGWGLGRLWGR